MMAARASVANWVYWTIIILLGSAEWAPGEGGEGELADEARRQEKAEGFS